MHDILYVTEHMYYYKAAAVATCTCISMDSLLNYTTPNYSYFSSPEVNVFFFFFKLLHNTGHPVVRDRT